MSDSFKERARQKILDSAVDFALFSFWAAVTGFVATAALVVWGKVSGLDENWIYAFLGAAAAFLVTILVVFPIIWIKRRRRSPVIQKGRKGLLNYMVDRDRSILEVSKDLTQITRETNKIGNRFAKESGSLENVKRAGGALSSLKGYKVAEKIARKIIKRVAVMKIHSEHLDDNVPSSI